MLIKKPKIIFIANSSWYIYNFRLSLLNNIKKKGYSISIIAPIDQYTSLLKKEGFKVIKWKLSRSSTNPFLETISIFELYKIIKKEKPNLIHNFTIKACLYGTLISKFFKNLYVVNAITGLGHLFISKSFKTNILRIILKPLYRILLKSKRSYIIFQNFEDKKYLTKFGLTDNKRSLLIKGSGVNINHFKSSETKKNSFQTPVKLLFPSRIIKEKGICEVLKAFNSLIQKGEKIELTIAGDIDNGNKSSLNKRELSLLENDQNIKLLGHVEHIKDVYENSDIIILPSWREGLSRSLIEAAAMQKPIITTNVPGCREIIDHGYSGLIIPPQDSQSLELAILLLIKNQNLAFYFGKNSRKKVIKEFEVNLINEETIKHYESLFE